MHRHVRVILLSLALLVLSPASIASASVTGWQRVDVTLNAEQTGSLLMVSGTLADSARLPAKVELSVPAGSKLEWIGEILGGPASEDPQVETTKRTVNGSDVYAFTLAKSRKAQVEVTAASSLPFDGSLYTPSVTWRSTEAVPEVRMSVRVPEGASVATAVAGAVMQPSDHGYALYVKSFKDVKAGDVVELAFAYRLTGATTGATPASGQAASGGITGPLIAVVVVLGAIVLVFASRGKRPAAAEDERPAQDGTAVARTEGDGVDELPNPAAERARFKRRVATGVVIVLVIGAGLLIGRMNTGAKTTGDTISETFSAGEPCATATFTISPQPGANPGATAESLFSALRPLTGLNTGTYDFKTSTLVVGYCESQSSEPTLRQALEKTGLLGQGAAAQ